MNILQGIAQLEADLVITHEVTKEDDDKEDVFDFLSYFVVYFIGECAN